MSDEQTEDRRGNLEARDVLGLAGLSLLGIGFAFVWLPLGLIVPGGVLVYLAIWGVPR